jgi:Coenzyme PQQ synthesis protein D (PqqD)
LETVLVTLEPSDTFRPHPAIASEVVDGELVVLQLDDGLYYGLDRMGTRMWERLVAGRCVREVVDELAQQYPDEPREKLSWDLITLAAKLVDSRLLVSGTSID